MRIDIITIFPDFFNNFFNYSIINRAQEKNIVELHIHNLRDYSANKQKSVDDYQYGGGAGMVMTIQPIDECINTLKSQREYDEIIYLSPDGHTLNQKICNKLSINENLIFLCGHYKGIDQRVRDIHITKEISIGDYVLTGGEAAAAILVDAVVRLIPGVISDETSALTDSFQDNLLAPPIYTRPSNFNGHKVPDILLSGNEQKINTWRDEESLRKTKAYRPDLLEE
ncbi:MAG: tRNA (guanosine(37)-N1)-methyltransferase TrmD [Flavobacteriales bacterium]|jgi:tRNA (guanine37-N1)-methyltransferase|nr:tRNA (guanosine(37)-N1)-methyltransferase TrmD [Flavobacteriales bacterium]MDC0909019.1 tRNA (guanosine(37)-N1)-methyltransferase TrmD [Flavobacteriales bacterium]